MINNKRVLAIIPARGGSKSIPYKNIVEIEGKPLIAYAIENGMISKYIDKVIVSTDDERIAKVAERFVEVIKRPSHLSTDSAKMTGVLKHVIENVKGFDIIVLLQPTSPFRTSHTVDRAIEEFDDERFDSLIPLKESEPKIGKVVDGKYQSLFGLDKQRQEMTRLYSECGTVYVYTKDNIKRGDPIGKSIQPFIIRDRLESFDLDEPEDLEFIKKIIRGIHNG